MQEEGRNYWEVEQQQPAATQPAPDTVEEPITWEASEYIHHQKDVLWFFGLVVVASVLVAISVLLIKSWTFTILVIVMIVAVVIFALRSPRNLRYIVSSQGLQIDEKRYELSEFRAFGVVQDGPLYSIILIPVKRFLPSVSLYFPNEQGEAIVDRLGDYVPMEDLDLDLIDKLVRKLRF